MASPYKIRLVHQGTTDDYYVLADIDSANTSDDPFDFYRHQGHYLPRYETKFVNGEVVVDTTKDGFVDLVLSDKVQLSREQGVIKGLEDQGLISVTELSPGELSAPTITSATFDGDGSETEAYEVDFQIVDETTNDGDYEITLTVEGGSAATFTTTDSNVGSAGVDDSAAIAADLQGKIDADPNFDATVSTDTVTVTSADIGKYFAYSTNVTDTNGAINDTVVNTGRIVIRGTEFTSVSPDTTSVLVRDDSSGEEVTVSETTITGDGGQVTDTEIVVLGSSHGLGTATGDVESVDVTADQQTDTSATTEL